MYSFRVQTLAVQRVQILISPGSAISVPMLAGMFTYSLVSVILTCYINLNQTTVTFHNICCDRSANEDCINLTLFSSIRLRVLSEHSCHPIVSWRWIGVGEDVVQFQTFP